MEYTGILKVTWTAPWGRERDSKIIYEDTYSNPGEMDDKLDKCVSEQDGEKCLSLFQKESCQDWIIDRIYEKQRSRQGNWDHGSEKIFSNHISDKVLVSKIDREFIC